MNAKEIPSNINFLISDFDGTLVDSMPVYIKCFVRTLEGIVDDKEELEKYYMEAAGGALSSQLRDAAFKFAGKRIEDTKELEAKFFDIYAEYPDITVLPGAVDALENIKKMGIETTVWSGTRTDVLGKKLAQAGLSPFVDFHIGNVPGSDTQVKGPGLFAEIARFYEILPQRLREQSVVIGDGKGDIEAGLAVGAYTVGLGPQRENLRKLGANDIIPSIADLPPLLRLK